MILSNSARVMAKRSSSADSLPGIGMKRDAGFWSLRSSSSIIARNTLA